MTGPNPPAGKGRWVNLGEVGVDGACIGISDPGTIAYRPPPAPWESKMSDDLSEPWGSGIKFMSGFGDGGYDVWGYVVDYGDGEVDERIAQVVITMIDNEDLRAWEAMG